MDRISRMQNRVRRRKGLKRQRITLIVIAAALLLAGVTGAGVRLWRSSHRAPAVATAARPTKAPAKKAPVYAVTFDTSASSEASVTPRSIKIAGAKLPVTRLPFAVAPGLRFVGWFTGPATDTAATLIDNRMLSQIATDTNTTLYARFEPRPEGVDRSVPGLPILMYHDFYDPNKGEKADPDYNGNMLNLDSFARQLDYLKQENYYFPSWEEVYAYVKGEIRLPNKSVVLTSDDGRPDVFEKAYPLLKQKNALMTSFVTGDMALMNKLDLSQIDPQYLDLRSHTFGFHSRESVAAGGLIAHASFEEIKADADKESAIIPQRFVMAYPYGQKGVDFNDATENALQQLGFCLAVSTNKGLVYPGQNPMALHRRAIGEPISLE
ncbi:MAG: polysaccharide deacetylase family protein, partial [Actinomycetia bacterium]|nr:polysaccharide deacetylase family protein [Actinomycetes bacterium]